MASWITPKTYVDGDYLTFSELNAAMGVEGDLQWLKDALESIGISADTGSQTVSSALLGCRVYGGAQEIPNAVWTPVVWSTQLFGKANGEDMDYLVPDHPAFVHFTSADIMHGYWAVGAHVAFAGNTVGERGVRLVHKEWPTDLSSQTVAASRVEEAVAAATEHSMAITTLYSPIFGTRSITCEVYQSSGDKLQLNASPHLSPEMWAVQLGRWVA